MKRIAVIQLKQIGDVLLSSPVCNSLKKTYPNAVIDYIIYDYTKGVVEGNPSISNLILVTQKIRKNIFNYIKFALGLRKNNYDIIINIQGKLEGALITSLSGAKKRIGFDRKGWRIFHNVIINEGESTDITGIGDTVDGRLSLLKGIGEVVKYDREYKIHLDIQEIRSLRKRMEKAGLDFSRPIFAFGITSRKDYRVWKLEYFKDIVLHLIKKYNGQIILFYTPGEKEYIKKAYDLIGDNKNVFMNIETKNVRELLAMMKNCDMYVGNDNGPRHFAQGLEIPALSIFSPRANKRFFNPHNNPKYVAIDLQDLLRMNDEEYSKLKKVINEENYFEYYYKITPDFVKMKMDEMVEKYIINII